jgi:hypothetical protein
LRAWKWEPSTLVADGRNKGRISNQRPLISSGLLLVLLALPFLYEKRWKKTRKKSQLACTEALDMIFRMTGTSFMLAEGQAMRAIC